MIVLKKIEELSSFRRINEIIGKQQFDGISLTIRYNSKTKTITISEKSFKHFGKPLLPTQLTLNMHILNEETTNVEGYVRIGEAISTMNSFGRIIISSQTLPRIVLDDIRLVVEHKNRVRQLKSNGEENYPSLLVASPDGLTQKEKQLGDMIYSSGERPISDFEFAKLIEYTRMGVPLLLNWGANCGQRIARLVQESKSSDDVMVLSKSQTPKRY